MHNTSYLYGLQPNELEDMFYFDALKHKKHMGTRLYRKLFLKHDKTTEDETQMFWVAKALKHTEKLLEERI